MKGHCWSLEEGWDAKRRKYRSMTPRALYAAWKSSSGPQAKGAFASWREPEGETLLRLAGDIGAGRVRLEIYNQERLRFETWMTGQGWAIDGDWNPAKRCYGDMTHRILWAAWRDQVILRRLAPYAALRDPASEYLASKAAGLPGQPTS